MRILRVMLLATLILVSTFTASLSLFFADAVASAPTTTTTVVVRHKPKPLPPALLTLHYRWFELDGRVTHLQKFLHVKPDGLFGVETRAAYSKSLAHYKLSQHLVPKISIDYYLWMHVNICEEGGRWNIVASVYSGGLGIRNSNWVAYGGTRFAWNGGLATPSEQVYIASRINYGYPVPDQHGCGSW